MMPTEPSVMEVTRPITAADSQKAYDQLMALARKMQETSRAKTVQRSTTLCDSDGAEPGPCWESTSTADSIVHVGK
jgi:hypothetical protein